MNKLKRWQRQLALVLCLALALAACVAEPEKPPLRPRSFDTIAIVSPYEFTEYVTPDTKGDRAAEGAKVGFSSMSLGAMAVGALACGPFLYGLCVAGLGLAGMAVGGVGGALYGVTGVSAADVDALDAKLQQLGTTRGMQSALVDSLRGKLPPAMLAPVDEASVQALVSIRLIEMRHSDDELYLKVTARFEYAREAGQDYNGGYREVEGRSSRHDIDYWLAADQAAMAAAMAKCSDKIAAEMAILLNQHWEGAL